MVLFLGSSITSCGIVVAYFTIKSAGDFKLAMKVLALTSRLILSTAWLSVMVFTAEIYPTVVR